MTPAISVVVPVQTGAATQRLCLEALGRTRGPTWECIVVDDGSTDDIARVARPRAFARKRREMLVTYAARGVRERVRRHAPALMRPYPRCVPWRVQQFVRFRLGLSR
jgi:glycosyltransferase involved in cell wall biosynthesis